jgi:hypothetical protein
MVFVVRLIYRLRLRSITARIPCESGAKRVASNPCCCADEKWVMQDDDPMSWSIFLSQSHGEHGGVLEFQHLRADPLRASVRDPRPAPARSGRPCSTTSCSSCLSCHPEIFSLTRAGAFYLVRALNSPRTTAQTAWRISVSFLSVSWPATRRTMLLLAVTSLCGKRKLCFGNPPAKKSDS